MLLRREGLSRPMSLLGQKAKYSLRAHTVRFTPDNGLKSDIAGGPFRANSDPPPEMDLFNHLVSERHQACRDFETKRFRRPRVDT